MNHFYKEQKSKRLPILLAILLTVIVIFFVTKLLFFYKNKKISLEKKVVKLLKKIQDQIGKVESKIIENNQNSEEIPNSQAEPPETISKPEGEKGKVENLDNKLSIENYNNFKEAQNNFKRFNYKEAIKYFTPIDPKNFEVLKNLGISYYKTKQNQNAKEYLTQANWKNNRDFLILKYLGLISYDEENFPDALKFMNSALEIKEDLQLSRLIQRVGKEADNRKDYGSNTRVHFLVKYSKSTHSDAEAQIVSILEDAYREICRTFDFYPEQKTEVILYTEKSFFDITRSPSWAGGLYDGSIRMPVRNLSKYQSELKRILFHEFVHAFLHHMADYLPTWLNEGLAEYYSRGPYEQTIGQIIPLNYLEFGFPSATKAAQVAYMESYSVVKYLISRYGLYRIKDFLKKLGEKKHFREAFKETFAITYQKFLNEWGKE